MKRLIKWLVVLGVLAGASIATYGPAKKYIEERSKPRFKTATVTTGDIVFVVNSTGEIKPVRQVTIGSFVSGPIAELHADFNQKVTEGQILAKVDPRIYQANVARDQAVLRVQQAEVARVTALLSQARNNEVRAIKLRDQNKDFISDQEMDQFKFNRMSLEAQLEVAEASIEQANGSLTNSKQNLDYTEIRSPVNGIILDRKIDPGQTLAAAFQVPELFIVAPDMDKEMFVYASVDEADIGHIRKAQLEKQPVKFTVDAYQDDLFEGTIHQIRQSSTKTQNVVTYPVVISAPNAELKLMPGMTASISFQVNRKDNVTRIPNTALRFYPKPEHVRPEDKAILEAVKPPEETDEEEQVQTSQPSAEARSTASKRRNQRHVWVQDPVTSLLRAVPIVTGIDDNDWTELVSGEIKPNDLLVTGEDKRALTSGAQ